VNGFVFQSIFRTEMVMIKHLLSTTEDEEDDDDTELSSNSSLPWFHSNSLWTNMIAKTYDQTYKSRPNFLESHPAINVKMRSVLCDWLIEVKFEFSTENL